MTIPKIPKLPTSAETKTMTIPKIPTFAEQPPFAFAAKTRADILSDFTFAQLQAATIDCMADLDDEIRLDGASMIYANIRASVDRINA